MGQAAVEQPIDVRPLTRLTGAQIHGVDLAKPLAESTVAAIRSALLRWKVVFFRDQQLGHAEQIAFAVRFGELTYAHPHESEPLPEFPEIYTVDRRRSERRYGAPRTTRVTGTAM